jgi:hypothetical protein
MAINRTHVTVRKRIVGGPGWGIWLGDITAPGRAATGARANHPRGQSANEEQDRGRAPDNPGTRAKKGTMKPAESLNWQEAALRKSTPACRGRGRKIVAVSFSCARAWN